MPDTVKAVSIDHVREKLVELLSHATFGVNKQTILSYLPPSAIAEVVGNLIANGVTVQEWISVNDGLPELTYCGAETAYSEAVNVVTTERKVLTAIWDGFDWMCDAEFWDAEDEEITHWTPVLLPLPLPPVLCTSPEGAAGTGNPSPTWEGK